MANSSFQVRSRSEGLINQLAVCYSADETDASKTRPYMQPAGGDDSQKWDIEP